MEESINLIEEVINIDDRLDLNNIKKINNYIGEILANTDNLILDKFENKFEHIDRTNNSHRYSDTYDIIDEDNDFFSFRRMYDIFGDQDNIQYRESYKKRKDAIYENDLLDAQIREMFESIYNNFIESNTEESKRRSKKTIEEIYNLENVDENKSFDDYYKLNFESDDNKKIISKIVNNNLKKLYKCNNDLLFKIHNNLISKDDIYKERGWFVKDDLLNNTMKKHNLLGTCVYCKENFVFDDIVYFKTLPKQKCKINNIQTNNLFCVCTKCYNTKKNMVIMNAPNSINEIKLILYSKYESIYKLNHKLIYQKMNTKNELEMKNVIEQHDNLVNKLNYYRYMNKNLEEEVRFEKNKHEVLKNLVDKNKELISNYFYFIYSVEQNNMLNVKNIKRYIEEIIDSKLKPTVDRVECKICLDKDVSLILPCGHNICKECYQKLKPSIEFENAFNCPHCRALVHEDSVKPLFIC